MLFTVPNIKLLLAIELNSIEQIGPVCRVYTRHWPTYLVNIVNSLIGSRALSFSDTYFPAFSWVLSLWLVVSRVCRVAVRTINSLLLLLRSSSRMGRR